MAGETGRGQMAPKLKSAENFLLVEKLSSENMTLKSPFGGDLKS